MRKAEPPPLSPTDTLSVSLRLILAEGLDHLDAHRADARAGDVEAIHQTRVALRRLRSALRLFDHHLDPVAKDGLNDGLCDLGRILGTARDWDVFVLETIPTVRAAAPDETDALASLLEPAQREREIAHVALRTVLDDPRTDMMLQDLRDWGSVTTAFATPDAAVLRIGDEAGSMLDRLAKRARRGGRKLSRQDDNERHALRKTLKSLRYGIEMLQALHAHGRFKRYRKRLSVLQEDLGLLNDAIAADALAAQLPALPGQAVIRHWSHARKRAALEELPDAWHRFRKMQRFW